MTNQHPITPPPELVREWNQEATGTHFEPYGYSEFIANRAAQWGADQELDKSNNWLVLNGYGEAASRLRATRRPKPPSLKEQALTMLLHLEGAAQDSMDTTEATTTIRRALEALDD
jgi:hypothetical protein